MLYIISIENKTEKRSNEKGKLFEELMVQLLKKMGWKVTSKDRRIISAGIEIDIKATNKTYADQELIAQCKAYRNPIERSILSDFWGQIEPEIAKAKNEKLQLRSLFFSTSELNGSAKGYYKDSFLDFPARRNLLKVYSNDELIELLEQNDFFPIKKIQIGDALPEDFKKFQTGEKRLLYTSQGFFWLLTLNCIESFSPVGYLILGEKGNLLSLKTDHPLLSVIKQEFHDIKDLPCLNTTTTDISVKCSITPISMSKSFFDYKYPSNPKFFIGREEKIKEAKKFFSEVCKNKTALRGIVIAANSGIGKSSFILKLKEECLNGNYYFYDIDTRSCDRSNSIFEVFEYVIQHLITSNPEKFDRLKEIKIGGLDSIDKTYKAIDSCLANEELLIIFFDQFENIYFSKENTDILKQALLKLSYENPKIIFGFAWKTDIFLELDIEKELDPKTEIVKRSKVIKLERFEIDESRKILEKIKSESVVKINKLVLNYLREKSQGYPLLFKKFGYHIINELNKSSSQEELITGGLNLKELFEEDLVGLSDDEVALLRKWSSIFPCEITELYRDLEEETAKRRLRKLIDKNLVIKVGNKYDAYCDLFREYLITGKVPFDELYILNTSPKVAIHLFSIIEARKEVVLEELIQITNKEKGTLYNLIKDLKTIGLINYSRNKISPLQRAEEINAYLKDKLLHNPCFRYILEKVKENNRIQIDSLINSIQEQFFPSVPRKRKTWQTYLRNFARWLNFVGLLKYGFGYIYPSDYSGRVVSLYPENTLPQGFVNPLINLLQALPEKGDITKKKLQRILGKASQTIDKSLTDGTRLTFISRISEGNYSITKEGRIFIESNTLKQKEIFREKVLEKYDVVRKYIECLRDSPDLFNDPIETFKKVIHVSGWAEMTLKTYSRTINNWCTFCELIILKGGQVMLKAKDPQRSLL